MQNNTEPKGIRVPSNTHPSHIYGAGTLHPEMDDEEEFFYSAQGTPASRPQSIRASIQNFAGSYSRASILYVADAISAPSSTTTGAPSIHIVPDDEEQSLFKPKTTYAYKQWINMKCKKETNPYPFDIANLLT
jgi:hypothetical protein